MGEGHGAPGDRRQRGDQQGRAHQPMGRLATLVFSAPTSAQAGLRSPATGQQMPAPKGMLCSEQHRKTTTHVPGATILSMVPAALRPESPALLSAQGKPQRPTAPKGEKVPDQPFSSPGGPPWSEEHRAETTAPGSASSFHDWPFPTARQTCTPNFSPSPPPPSSFMF